MTSELGSAPGSESSTPPVEKKWEVAFLFDGTRDDAEELLERLFDATSDAIAAGIVGSLLEITDLEAWENCRCGHGSAS